MDPDLWRAVLRIKSGAAPAPGTATLADLVGASSDQDRALLDLYRPFIEAPGRLVVAHLGQSLDGRIALANGRSKWITGRSDIVHNHRMRALADAVIVGAGTVLADDPRLTVREVEGPDPVRVVLDPGGRLGPHHAVFTDRAAPTLLIRRRGGRAPAGAELLEIEAGSPADLARAVLERLAERGLLRVFIEGGGVTVSRFLEAGCLDRLQITVAPVILGSGRPGISLPPIGRISDALRPATRRFPLDENVLFEMAFSA